jgi:twitching motility protein PilT|tara:strand:- start:1004 stop:2008 length:1005 start_codon:yes stop_codon:yes gene_type:complete
MDDVIYKISQEKGLSDIHFQTGMPVALRINGSIIKQENNIVTKAQISKFISEHIKDSALEKLENEKNIDLAIQVKDIRFRANVFDSMNGRNIVLRKIESVIPNYDSLNFPSVLGDVIQNRNGLILVTGPTGCGKSTSLAAMINRINESRQANIITIEDPIEYIHQPKQSIISQREVGNHATTFASALRASLREDPDVILVGELRDLETVALALTAAETGHLVFGTVHTSGAPNTIHRIVDVFPPSQQDQIRAQIATCIKLVMTQRLIKKADDSGRVAAFEIMVSNVAVQNLIRENKIHQIPSAMQTGAGDGMLQMEKSIEQLLSAGVINYDEAH